MAFNISKASANAKKDLDNKCISALIIGASGVGKSGLLGTFGVKTLFLYTGGEAHGIISADTWKNAEVVPIRLDEDDDGKPLDANGTYARLLEILGDAETIKSAGFGAIAVDGLTEVEAIIRETKKWRGLCLTSKGDHNSFAEGPAVLAMMRPVLVRIRDLQLSLGIHYAFTCLAKETVLGENGQVETCTPSLSTYSVAEFLVPQFPDRFTVGEMVNSKGERKQRIQFNATVIKHSKAQDGTILKTSQFKMRLQGVKAPPEHTDADLSLLAKLKATKEA